MNNALPAPIPRHTGLWQLMPRRNCPCTASYRGHVHEFRIDALQWFIYQRYRWLRSRHGRCQSRYSERPKYQCSLPVNHPDHWYGRDWIHTDCEPVHGAPMGWGDE